MGDYPIPSNYEVKSLKIPLAAILNGRQQNIL